MRLVGSDGEQVGVLTTDEAKRYARERDLDLVEKIIRAVDGPITLGDFIEPHTDGACDHDGQCVLLSIWHTVGADIRRQLEAWTLADVKAMAAGDQPWPEPA